MKTASNVEDVRENKTIANLVQNDMNSLREQLASYEQERHILLNLSNDFTRVREKNDLIKILSSRLKSYFYFTHAVVSLIDHKSSTYYPFLIDIDSLPINHRTELPVLLNLHYVLSDPFISEIADAELQVSILLDEIINKPGIPAFLKVNYECGIRKVLIAKLKSKMETIGFLFIYSDRTDSFSDDFKKIIQAIAPHLSNAVSNIIINDEIRYKERENDILLSLSNDTVTVRNRTDLLKVINFGLKKLIYFTHSVMTESNETGETYHAFLLDPNSQAKKFPEYTEAITTPNPVQDGIYDVASLSDKPVVFNMSSVDQSKAPLWFRLNYEAGAKEMLIKILPGEAKHKHSIILFSDRLNNFTDKPINIVERISSQLSTAASNISANEEILRKEKDKSFLLEFSHDIASARTKNELSVAIHHSLKKLSEISAYFIRTINEDGVTMSPFMHDDEVHYINTPEFKELLVTKIPVNAGITAKVLSSDAPVLIDFEEEVNNGNTDTYIEFWKKLKSGKAAFQKIIGTPLRFGSATLGILWVITDTINMAILEGICDQIAVAISNIQSNQEIAEREAEKTTLLALSEEIAALRSRNDLLHIVNTRIKTLFAVEEFGIAQIDQNQSTYSAFVLDLTDNTTNHTAYKEITSAKYKVTDPLFTRIMQAEDPVLFDVPKIAQERGMPDYVTFWKHIGLRCVLAMALRVGGKNMGCVFLHINRNETEKIKTNLLKAVCNHLSVAVSNILANEQLLAYKRMLEIENDHLKEEIKTIYNFNEIIGSGAAMQKVYHLMSLVAESNSTVLLLGETGTGKELIARAIHNASPRRDKLMIKVNCAALPPNLIESELFGHERGAFTGATERRIGKFELANNSTLFLDEIGELPLDMQVKLLRVIQERELERVGGRNTISINVRIIAATNRNLEEEVNAGNFRSDLYYRLNVFPIHLPPLRERLDDIESLAYFFLARYSKNTGRKVTGISANVLKELKAYLWPGNVRELEHLIERSILLTTGSVLKEIQLPKHFGKEKGDLPDVSNKTLNEIERLHIIEVLTRCNGKIAGIGGAAIALEIPPTTLHSKMKKLGISKKDYFQKSSN